MKINPKTMVWIREPKVWSATDDSVEITTEPFIDLWQRTYYHFRNDNAPVLQIKSKEHFFSFIVKTEFDTKVRYDQSGIVISFRCQKRYNSVSMHVVLRIPFLLQNLQIWKLQNVSGFRMMDKNQTALFFKWAGGQPVGNRRFT